MAHRSAYYARFGVLIRFSDDDLDLKPIPDNDIIQQTLPSVSVLPSSVTDVGPTPALLTAATLKRYRVHVINPSISTFKSVVLPDTTVLSVSSDN